MVIRKKDVYNWYKTRSELTAEKAENLFCNKDILSYDDDKFHDGVKLCTFLLLEKLSAAKAWDLIRETIVITNPSSVVCLNIGDVLRRSYRDSSRSVVSEGFVTRRDIANLIFKPLMEHCILVKRKYAEKFCIIFRGVTFERDEAMSVMLSETSTPVFWRYLNAKNAHVRMGAFHVQRSVFPPSFEDAILSLDYFNKHCDAFIKALQDPVVEICTQAIEHVCELVAMFYEQISTLYIDQIFDELANLAVDENIEVRAALYRGLRYFQECANSILKFETLLKKICLKGIDDVSEKVRCNVFRLLNSLTDSRLTIISKPRGQDAEALLPLENVLYRMDYEESEAVEREIGRLLFVCIFNKDMSNQARYTTLSRLCRLNRNASLNMHRLIYTIKVCEPQEILSHLANTLSVCTRLVKTIVRRMDESRQSDAFVDYTLLKDNTTMNSQDRTCVDNETEKQLSRLKDVTDCLIVCYATMRYDPIFDASIAEAQIVSRHFCELANEIITHFEMKSGLLDTALAIIALVRNAGIHAAKIKNNCTRMLRAGHLNARYLEIFGLIDMDELLKLLQNGLTQLENSILDTENALARKRAHNSTEFVKKKIAVDALLVLLNLPSCNQYVVEKFMHYIIHFIEALKRICETLINDFKNIKPEQMQLFLECWKLRTILLIINHNKDMFADSEAGDGKPSKREVAVQRFPNRRRSAVILSKIEDTMCLDPMVEECKWFESRVQDDPQLTSDSELLEHFYHTIELHLKAYKHTASSVEQVMTWMKKLYELSQTYSLPRPINQAYHSCTKAGNHALEFADPDTVALEPLMEVDE